MRYVVVGGGVAGVAAAQRLRALAPAARVILIEAEAVPHYLRPGLIEVLAGEKELSEITPYPKSWFEKQGIEYLLGEIAVALEPARQEISLASGKRIPYEKLLLATGAEPLRPEIPGLALPGVFTLRTASDAERIRTWAAGAQRAVVLGGGWLGLEAAHALRRFLPEVVVLDHGPWPLPRQLDETGGTVLAGLLRKKGLEMRPNAEIKAILGKSAVEGVQLLSGEFIPAELVLIAIGVRPRTALAKEAGIAVNSGILVNDFLEASVPGVYAAGDVAEWRGRVYGTVRAAREQALVAAQNMVEPGSARYPGTRPSQRLKVAGIDLLILGETQPKGGPQREVRRQGEGYYVKLVLNDEDRLLGAIVIGGSDLFGRLEELFQSGEPIPPSFLSSD